MQLLFVQLNKARGLTWAVRDSPPRAGSNVLETVNQIVAQIVSCKTIVVGWDISSKLTSMFAVAERAGLAVPAVEMIEMRNLACRAAEPDDAAGVAAAYYSTAVYTTPPKAILPVGAAPSAEQRQILLAFERRHNIVCRAVYGAGKTTTLLMCAARRPAAACLLLTYNKGLQLDVSGRARAGMGVMTYHAAAGKAYGRVVPNDDVFRAVVRAAPPTPPCFDVLLLDEAQDMSVEYYAFVRWLLVANPGAQLIVVGDERQAINEYRGSRSEFLSEAARLYETYAAPRPWSECTLSVSHRLTPSTARFLNRHLLGGFNVVTGGNTRNADLRPIYAAARTKADITLALATQVRTAVQTYGAAGVFVLAPSVRNLTNSNSPLADLVRRHLAGIPAYVAGHDDAKVDSDLIAGKLAILSFNASKGRERPCVILVGLDETYFDYFDKAWANEAAIPNVLTVAASRASARLVIVACSYRTLRTIGRPALDADAELVGSTPSRPAVRARPPPKVRQISVTNLVRHLHPETVAAAMQLVSVSVPNADIRAKLRSLPPAIVPDAKVRFGNFFEDLSFAYGLIGPVLAELSRTGETAFGEGLDAPTIVDSPEQIRPFGTEITEAEYAAYPEFFWESVTAAALTDPEDRSYAEWMRLAVARHALEGGHHHVARQVTHYRWVNSAALISTRDAILHMLQGIEGVFEQRLPTVRAATCDIVGRADFITVDGIVWEFKSGSGDADYREEHVLQLACYLALLGGGNGILFAGRMAHHVSVAPDDAALLLQTLALKARAPEIDIYALIEHFDSGGEPPAAAALAESVDPRGQPQLDLDDVL